MDPLEMNSEILHIAEDNSNGLISQSDQIQLALRTGQQEGMLSFRFVQLGDNIDVSPNPNINSVKTETTQDISPISSIDVSNSLGPYFIIKKGATTHETNLGVTPAKNKLLAIKAGPKPNGGQQPIQMIRKRDDKRRFAHNEIERRRRDKINSWIVELSKQIPDCNQAQSSVGHHSEALSKGGILAKACEYITQLKESNDHLKECLAEKDIEIQRLNELNEKLMATQNC